MAAAERAGKASLRHNLLTARAGLSAAERQQASAAACARLRHLPELRGARAVLAYAAFGSELDVDPFLEHLLAREVGVFLPWVDGERLGIARVTDLAADLSPGWRGVREPRGLRPARPDRLDAVIVPGVGFDPSGGRLGYGGGHFDRLLATVRPGTAVVGVAHDVQLVACVPSEPHDRPVDLIVTPTQVVRAPGRSGNECV